MEQIPINATFVETKITILAETVKLNGKIEFDQLTKIHGSIIGEVSAPSGSTLILSETAYIEGTIHGDEIVIDGMVKGNIKAKTRVQVGRSGRIIGKIETPALKVDFGAHIEGDLAILNQ